MLKLESFSSKQQAPILYSVQHKSHRTAHTITPHTQSKIVGAQRCWEVINSSTFMNVQCGDLYCSLRRCVAGLANESCARRSSNGAMLSRGRSMIIGLSTQIHIQRQTRICTTAHLKEVWFRYHISASRKNPSNSIICPEFFTNSSPGWSDHIRTPHVHSNRSTAFSISGLSACPYDPVSIYSATSTISGHRHQTSGGCDSQVRSVGAHCTTKNLTEAMGATAAESLHGIPNGPLVTVAVGQMTATNDLEANFQVCARLVQVCSTTQLSSPRK